MRKGYGSLVCKSMAKKLADMDMDTTALVGHQNKSSQEMFKKIGFQSIGNAYWLRTRPLIPFEWSDDDDEDE